VPVNHRPGYDGGGFAAVDVCYPPAGGARAAIVVAGDVALAGRMAKWTAFLPRVLPYRSGQFFLRELPPLRAVLADVGHPSLVVIDGYVDLDPHGLPGLGSYVHQEFTVPVVGVAKTSYRTASHAVPVLRGASARPLFVTAAGVPLPEAAGMVRQMAGRFRLPDALRRVDALARGTQLPA
jgi:deoxyribonuclease V